MAATVEKILIDCIQQGLMLPRDNIANDMLNLGYNLTFVQHQGRYLFSALVPIGIAVALAWGMLIRPITRRWRSRSRE